MTDLANFEIFSRPSIATIINNDNISDIASEEKRLEIDKGILIEGQRTNLNPYSIASVANWKTYNGIVTQLNNNYLTQFDGVKVTAETSYSQINAVTIPLIGNTSYVLTVWFVVGSSGQLYLRIRDLTNSKNSSIRGFINNLSIIHDAGNIEILNLQPIGDVFIITCKFTSLNNADFRIGIGPNSSSIGEDIIVLGLQIEEGYFATSYIKTLGSTVTRSADNLSYELGLGQFPQKFILSMDVTPIADGGDYLNEQIRLFSTTDTRGENHQIRTLGADYYGFDGRIFYLKKSDFLAGLTTKLKFVLYQDNSEIRAVLEKDDIIILNISVFGILDHSNSGILSVGHYLSDYFFGYFNNITLYQEIMSLSTTYSQNFWGDAIKYELEPKFNRDTITVVSGSGELKQLTLLGKITASNKFTPLNPAASDGSQTAAAILFSNIDATTADATAVALVRGPAIIKFSQLVFVNTLDETQQDTAKAELLSLLSIKTD